MTHAKALADQILPGEGWLWSTLRIAAANLLLVLCAWLALPLPWTPVPVTGQTFGVLFVAVLLGSQRGAFTLALYLAEGAAGLPVFQPFGLPGPARFFGPTAGYLLAYPAAAFLTGWIVERGARRSLARLGGALLAGEFVIFACGCAWLARVAGLGWSHTLAAGLLPFLPGEVLKLALVLAAIRGVETAGRSN